MKKFISTVLVTALTLSSATSFGSANLTEQDKQDLLNTLKGIIVNKFHIQSAQEDVEKVITQLENVDKPGISEDQADIYYTLAVIALAAGGFMAYKTHTSEMNVFKLMKGALTVVLGGAAAGLAIKGTGFSLGELIGDATTRKLLTVELRKKQNELQKLVDQNNRLISKIKLRLPQDINVQNEITALIENGHIDDEIEQLKSELIDIKMKMLNKARIRDGSLIAAALGLWRAYSATKRIPSDKMARNMWAVIALIGLAGGAYLQYDVQKISNELDQAIANLDSKNEEIANNILADLKALLN